MLSRQDIIEQLGHDLIRSTITHSFGINEEMKNPITDSLLRNLACEPQDVIQELELTL